LRTVNHVTVRLGETTGKDVDAGHGVEKWEGE